MNSMNFLKDDKDNSWWFDLIYANSAASAICKKIKKYLCCQFELTQARQVPQT